MKVYHGRTDIERFEHLVETSSQTVTHLVLPAEQAIGQHPMLPQFFDLQR